MHTNIRLFIKCIYSYGKNPIDRLIRHFNCSVAVTIIKPTHNIAIRKDLQKRLLLVVSDINQDVTKQNEIVTLAGKRSFA